jgi:hypothetical protein
VGEMINSYEILIGKFNRNKFLEDFGVDGRILKLKITKYNHVGW